MSPDKPPNQPPNREGTHRPSQNQVAGNIRVQGSGHNLNFAQGEIINIDQSQKKIIQVSVDEIKTREFIPSSPYKGLKRFEPEDKDRFFGRSQFITGLETELEETNFVLLLGASGSGKSSVVRAGLVPQLSKKWETRWVNVTFTPDRDPFESLYGSLLSQFSQSKAEIARAGQENTLAQVVETLKEPASFWFIFIDQFEELFTTTEAEKRDRFIKSLAQLCKAYAGDSTVKIMATMRSDFLDRFDAEPANWLAQITAKHRPLITQMQADELREVIEQPAAHHGVVFEEGLVETIIKEVQGQAGYLPLLQYTLARLWQAEVKDGGINDRTLNTQSYRRLGGVRGALQQRIEEIYQALSASEKLATQRIFLRLVGIGGDSATAAEWKPVRKREARSRFSDKTEQTVLAQLIDANLLVSSAIVEGRESASMVEIAHEILLTSWGQLREWIEGNREAIAFRNRLNEDVERWKVEKPDDELWSGTKLAKAVDLQNDPAFTQVLGGFSEEAAAFIDSSVGLRDREAQEKEAQRQRELAQERKARKTAQRVTIGALIGGLLMAGAAAFSAFQMKQSEIQQVQASIAQSKAEFANKQILNADIASIRAARLLQKSFWQRWFPSPHLSTLVLWQLQQTSLVGHERNRIEIHELNVRNATFSSDGTRIATTGDDGAVHLWDTTGQQIAKLTGYEGDVSNIVLSPDGTQIAITSNDSTVRLWDANSQKLTELKGYQGSISDVTFSPNGIRIATTGNDGTVRLWDTTGQLLTELEVTELEDPQGIIWDSVVFSPDGTQIAAVSVSTFDDTTAHLWKISGQKLTELKGPQGPQGRILDVAFSLNGVQIATDVDVDGAGRMVHLWGIADQQRIDELISLGSFSHLVLSPDGRQIATYESYTYNEGSSSKVSLWDTTGRQITELQGHQGYVWDVVFSPDGTQIATYGDSSIVHLWDLSGQQVAELKGSQGKFSPDGRLLVTDTGDTARLWAFSGEQPEELKGFTENARDTAFSPDGKLLATYGDDSGVSLWDITGQQVEKLKSSQVRANGVEFSPDGKLLATYGEDATGEDTARLWDLSSKQQQLTELKELKGFTGDIRDIVFSPDGKLLATYGEDSRVHLWDIIGQRIVEFEGTQVSADGIEFSSDGKLLATYGEDSNGEDSRVYLWDTSGQQVAELKSSQVSIDGVEFSPDSRLLVTDEGSTARLWDLSKEKQVKELKGPIGSIGDMVFSPDSKLLAIRSHVRGNDDQVVLWSTAGERLAELKGRQSSVYDVTFSRDSTLITTRGEDDEGGDQVILWDTTGKRLAELKGPQGNFWNVAFSPSGTRFATFEGGTGFSSFEGSRTRLWLSGSIDEILSKKCDWVQDYLTNPNSDALESDRSLCDGVPEFSQS